MQKITTFLWFDGRAEEAIQFYVSLFKNSRIVSTMPGPDGKLLTGTFELHGQRFMALNGGPRYRFTEAISLLVRCDTQAEVNDLWAKLSDGGSTNVCGWLKDRFGLSWQIVPRRFFELISDPDPAKVRRVMQAMMGMARFEIAELERAARG